MKKFLKNFSYVLCCIAIASSVSGCSLKKTTTTTTPKVFTIWSFEDEDVWKPAIKEIQKDLKGYEIKYVKKTLTNSYENDSLNSILSGQGPDIWAIPNDWVYRHKDKLAPMPDSLVASSKINLDEQFVPAIKESVYFDNKIYGLSPTVNTFMVYYNSTLLDQALEDFRLQYKAISSDSDTVRADKTAKIKLATKLLSNIPTIWSDFVEMSKIITKKNGTDIERAAVAMGTSANVDYSTDVLYALMLQNGTRMLSTDLKLSNFNLPQDTASGTNDYPAKRALEFYNSFANPESPNYCWNSSLPDSTDAFGQSKVAIIIGPDSLSQRLTQQYPSLKFKKAALPQISSEAESIIDYGTFNAFVTPKQSNNTTAAWNAINNLYSSQINFANSVKISTSLKKKDFTPSIKDRLNSSVPGPFQNQTSHTWVKGRYPYEVDTIFRNTIESALSGQISSQAALDSAALKVTDLLKRENW